MAEYDVTSKVLFRDYGRDFISLALAMQEFEILESIPVELPSVQMRVTDAPTKVRLNDGREVIVHIEFQTETSIDPMQYRISEYIGRLIHEHRLPVCATAIYLKPSAGVSDPGGYSYEFGNLFEYNLRYQVIRMAEIDGQAILDRNSPIGLLPFSPLMKHPQAVDKENWLEQCTQAVLKIPLESEEKRRDYVACFCVLSNLVYEEAVVQKLMEEIQTMIDIENSTVIKIFTEKTEIKAYTDVLLQIIETEFGESGIEELEPRIRAIENAQQLASLVIPAHRAASVEEFKRTLDSV